MKKKLGAFSTLPQKIAPVCVCVKKLGDLAIELGLNQSKFSLKSFSNLAIFPEVPEDSDEMRQCSWEDLHMTMRSATMMSVQNCKVQQRTKQ